MPNLPFIYDHLSLPEAVEVQNNLRLSLDITERHLHLNTIGGADISLNLYSSTLYAGIIILSFPQLRPIAYSVVKAETHFPYIPGFLAFREVPGLVEAWQQLPQKPDLLVVDGHGIAHPRHMGIAAHFGALTQQPSMGCAKKILIGKWEQPGMQKNASQVIYDKNEPIGYAFRSKANTAPVYISPGSGIGLENSLDVARNCTGKYRIPEPTRLAHELVNRFRKGELPEGYHTL